MGNSTRFNRTERADGNIAGQRAGSGNLPDRQPQFRVIATVRVMITSTGDEDGHGRLSVPDMPERWIGRGKRIAMQLNRIPVDHGDHGYLPAIERHPRREYLTKKENRIPYRSANFSTTRTLSPRTVIGIGTMLS